MATNNNSLKKEILDGVRQAQVGDIERLLVHTHAGIDNSRNQFLFFLKPELTEASKTVRLDLILDFVFDQIDQFKLSIKDISVIGASYLDRYNIIAQHYGVINQLAKDASHCLSEAAKSKFKEVYNKDVTNVAMLGGIEFLDKYDAFTPLTLDIMWQQLENVKLSGGTYCEKLKLDGSEVFLVNGFHPRQLAHFTDKGKSIVTMTLVGDLAWSTARNDFIGATRPQNANVGSLRKTFLDKQVEFGLSEVSQGVNGVHLSAGPIESLVEMIRYTSDFSDNSKIKTYNDFSFGQKLAKFFSESQIADILSNKKVLLDEKYLPAFDLTEEKDSDDAINDLLRAFNESGQV